MEDKYDPKEIIEIVISSKKYLNQTIEEARNILSQKTPKILDSLDSLLKFMENRTISYNNNLSNDAKNEFRLDGRDRIILYMFDNYFMAGIVSGISEYAKNLDPKDPDYNEKVDNIKGFIQRDLTDITIFRIIYSGFLKKVFNPESKEKKSLKDYNYILQEMSNNLMNTIENLLEYRIKNREQFYNSLLEITKRIYE